LGSEGVLFEVFFLAANRFALSAKLPFGGLPFLKFPFRLPGLRLRSLSDFFISLKFCANVGNPSVSTKGVQK
jgi:hypothetical protein